MFPGIPAREHAGFGEGGDVRHGAPQGRHLAADQRQARLVAHVHDQHAPVRQEGRCFLVELGAGKVLRSLGAGEDIQDDDVEAEVRGQLGQRAAGVADDRFQPGSLGQRQLLQHEVQQFTLQLHGVLQRPRAGCLDVPGQGQGARAKVQGLIGSPHGGGEVHHVADPAEVLVEDVRGIRQINV